jgi:hypothetical protein
MEATHAYRLMCNIHWKEQKIAVEIDDEKN